MAGNHPPFYDRILFKLLLPVMIVGLTCSTLLVAYTSAPMKAFLTRQFDANLQTASVMGLRVCEESLTYLLDTVWGGNYVAGDRSVDNAVLRLRKKLGDLGEAIETVWGVGYRLRAKEVNAC